MLTLLVGDQTYNGTGINIIARCMDGTIRPEAFFLKMLFTAVTLGAGYKGGEIVPSLFTGAAFGCLFGNVLRIFADTLHGGWHVRGLLRRDKLSDHLAAHQL